MLRITTDPAHWSDLQDNVDEAISPELLEGWDYGPDDLERIEAAEAWVAEMEEAEAIQPYGASQ